MQNMFTSVSSEQPRYRSGAVARMAHIPVSTLRIWERRYQVIDPAVTDSGHRLYTGADVERLRSAFSCFIVSNRRMFSIAIAACAVRMRSVFRRSAVKTPAAWRCSR